MCIRDSHCAVQHKPIPGSGDFLEDSPEEVGKASQAFPCLEFLAGLAQQMPAAIGFGIVVGGLGDVHLPGIAGHRTLQTAQLRQDRQQILPVRSLILRAAAALSAPFDEDRRCTDGCGCPAGAHHRSCLLYTSP